MLKYQSGDTSCLFKTSVIIMVKKKRDKQEMMTEKLTNRISCLTKGSKVTRESPFLQREKLLYHGKTENITRYDCKSSLQKIRTEPSQSFSSVTMRRCHFFHSSSHHRHLFPFIIILTNSCLLEHINDSKQFLISLCNYTRNITVHPCLVFQSILQWKRVLSLFRFCP